MSEEIATLPQLPVTQKIIVHDNSEFSALLDTGKFEQLWRIATIFAGSQLVPVHYQKSKENCFLGLQMAFRLGVDPMMLMQNTFVIGGRPGMESKMIIALINSSGLFEDPLEYEIVGDDPKDAKYKVRAFANRKGTGKSCLGPWIDWSMVRAEGWDSKNGSKWKSIPSQMFCYRAAAFFGRLYCPERLLGMQTAEELQDITPVNGLVSGPMVADVVSRFNNGTVPDELNIEPEAPALEDSQTKNIKKHKDIIEVLEPEPESEPIPECEYCQRNDGQHDNSCPDNTPTTDGRKPELPGW